jgi:ribosomal protein L24E
MDLDKSKLLNLYPGYTSVLGPYKRPDDRQHVILNNNSLPKGAPGKNKTISLPKAIVESITGVRLTPNQTVDHNDRNKLNDNPSNLVVRNRSEHSSLDALRVQVQPVNCVNCGCSFIPSRGQINSRAASKAGPFCSSKCSGHYGAAVQNGRPTLERQPIEKTYYRLNK